MAALKDKDLTSPNSPSIQHENQTQTISENKLQSDIQNQSKTSRDQTTLNDKEGPKI